MYFSKLPYIIFRDYHNFGYLTDNRNYGYDTATKSCTKIGERIISKEGSVFYSMLAEKPLPLEDISKKLALIYKQIPLQQLENDAKDFFLELSKDGFIKYSESQDTIIETNYFSYKNTSPLVLSEEDNIKSDILLENKWHYDYTLLRLHLSVTNCCNERCVHCYFPSHSLGDIMTKELFVNIINQCRELKVLNITISGGEPLINPNLAFFIQKCREYNFSINILSNLTLLTEPLIKEFQKTPLLSIQTSLYSMNETVHDSITSIKGSFQKTKEAIEILHRLNIPMQINCPIMKQNKESYKEVIEWAKSINIEASSDYMLFGCFDGSRRNLSCRLELFEIEKILAEEKENLSTINTKEEPYHNYICPVCYSSLCISPTGKVYPCEGWQSYNLGDINDTTISDIWENSLDVRKLRTLTAKDFPKCNHCIDREFCSICLIRNVNESNSLDYRDINPYFCTIANIKRKLGIKN